jgi:hypothetical protein
MSCVADVVCQCPGLSALQRADGENRSENRGGSLAAIIADFCNKICQKRAKTAQLLLTPSIQLEQIPVIWAHSQHV